MPEEGSPWAVIASLDGVHGLIGTAYRELFRLIVRAGRSEVWREEGARDLPHFLSLRYGISLWKAHRWVAAAHALERLPRIAEALASGRLGVDKVVELARFATPETEARLLPWARRVSARSIRERGDLLARRGLAGDREADRGRFCCWWYFDEGRRFGLQAELPAASGTVVARALERVAEQVPVLPGEEEPWGAEARRADALVALASARLAADPDPDRATVVVHVTEGALLEGRGGAEVEGGPAIAMETARRLACSARLQVMVEDREGRTLGVGRLSREPPAWVARQVRHRDRGCTFPGCGTQAFTVVHHIRWWRHGGRTDLDNLTLVCTFHHKLVHEYRWGLRREPDGTLSWSRPDGTAYHPGPGPPKEPTGAAA